MQMSDTKVFYSSLREPVFLLCSIENPWASGLRLINVLDIHHGFVKLGIVHIIKV